MNLEMNKRGYNDMESSRRSRISRTAILLSLAAAILLILITIIVVLNVVLPDDSSKSENRTGTYREYYSIPYYHRETTTPSDQLITIGIPKNGVIRTDMKPEKSIDNGMFNKDMYMGDMMGMDDKSKMVYNSPELRWPGGIIPYEMDSKLNCPHSPECQVILEAMEEYHDKTCIRFVPVTPEDTYKIKIIRDTKRSCWSYVGFQRQKYRSIGFQQVNLGEGCFFKGTVVHELGHTVGFWHEQNRNDRDKWIKIHWQNVHPNHVKNFKLVDEKTFPIIDDFDYRSVMMYGETAFSLDGKSLTIEPLKERIKLIPTYHKQGLSRQDIERISFMYKCS